MMTFSLPAVHIVTLVTTTMTSARLDPADFLAQESERQEQTASEMANNPPIPDQDRQDGSVSDIVSSDLISGSTVS